MNEKIQNLIKELAAECANDDLGMSVSVVDEKGKSFLDKLETIAWLRGVFTDSMRKQNVICRIIIAIVKLMVL